MASALAVASITTAGYAGSLVGPAGVGFIAKGVGLPGAFWILAALLFPSRVALVSSRHPDPEGQVVNYANGSLLAIVWPGEALFDVRSHGLGEAELTLDFVGSGYMSHRRVLIRSCAEYRARQPIAHYWNWR
jgi:hypothetical protein